MTAWRTGTATVLATWLCVLGVHSQEAPPGPKPTLYLVTNSHLDTQWNWTVQDSIRQFIPATFYDNFSLIERFPDYVFNLESVIHYMWFKEYHPEAWPTLQKYVAAGRWRLAGSWIDAADTNVPSPESLMRQALYGKRFYRREFNSVSEDVYLPDCFGFGFALPSIGAHSGLRAFSTQKLSWGASKPAPFAVGTWRGVDGSSLVAALRPGDYVMQVTDDISTDPKWTSDLVSLGDGRQVGFRYYGLVGGMGREGDPQPGRRGRGAQYGRRSARARPDGRGARGAPLLRGGVAPQDARGRLLYVAGGDEGVEPAERAAGRCGRARQRGCRVAGRPGVPG
jgi:hypothetical protein